MLDLKAKAQDFFNHLQRQMDESQVRFQEHWQIDHICYRVESLERYEELKQHLGNLGTQVIESPVQGRPIATFKLNHPFFFMDRQIDVLELPAPKAGKIVKDGFEHIEVVVDQTFSEIQSSYPKVTFKESGLKKDFNPELAMKLDGVVIKFHHQSLESVINLEANKPVFEAITKSQMLSSFRDHQPVIAGTFPLGIHHSESDVDVLLTSDDLKSLQKKLQGEYGKQEGFKSYISDDSSFMVANFSFQGVPFEVYANKTQSVRQRAFKHFHIEERLLKLGEDPFRDKIISLRNQGIKTEPAFATALGLKGDPYLALLDIHSLAEEKLRELFKT